MNRPSRYRTVERYLKTDKAPETSMVLSHGDDVTLKWSTSNYTSTADPAVWGPAFWFTLHNSAAHYPVTASPITRERCKGFVLGIPYMVPCKACSDHASAFIDKYKSNLDQICSGRHNLFDFYRIFHNFVNERFGKKQMSYDEAFKLYQGGSNVSKLTY